MPAVVIAKTAVPYAPRIWRRSQSPGPNSSVSALDYVIQTYVRDPERLATCIEALLAGGARTRYDLPGVLPILRDKTDELAMLLDAGPSLVYRCYPPLDCGHRAAVC
jgi:hypothetical protein